MKSTPATAEALTRFDTGLLSDAVERVHGPTVPVGIRPLCSRPRRIAGRAVTVQLGPASGKAPAVHLGSRAIDSARAGDILVVANDGRLDAAAWGGLLSAGAAVKGVEGVVIDGACRDVDGLLDMGPEFFCKGVVPLTARGRIAQQLRRVHGPDVCSKPSRRITARPTGNERGNAMTSRRVSVFFYGLFMDEALLRTKGAQPTSPRQASVRGFALRIGRRAALVPVSDAARVYGILMDLSHDELERLYTEPSVSMYRPEPVVAELVDGAQVPALCFNLPIAPQPGESNDAYAQELRALARRLGLPADYVDRIG